MKRIPNFVKVVKPAWNVLNWREKAIFFMAVGTIIAGSISGTLQYHGIGKLNVKIIVFRFPLYKRTQGRFPDIEIAYQYLSSVEIRLNAGQSRIRFKYDFKNNTFATSGGVNIPVWEKFVATFRFVTAITVRISRSIGIFSDINITSVNLGIEVGLDINKNPLFRVEKQLLSWSTL